MSQPERVPTSLPERLSALQNKKSIEDNAFFAFVGIASTTTP